MAHVERKITTTAHLWKTARVHRGLSISEVAQAAGVAPRTLQRIEAGEIARPRMATVRATARVLGCSPADLVLPEEVAA